MPCFWRPCSAAAFITSSSDWPRATKLQSIPASLHLISLAMGHLLCLQETKVEDEKFPSDCFKEAGYQPFFSGQKSYNGVAFLSKRPVEQIQVGFPDLPVDEQKRLMAVTLDGIRVI